MIQGKNEEVGVIDRFGGSVQPIYDSALYRWDAMIPISDIFPDGVPSSLSEAKSATYKWIKQYLSDIPFTDVFEEGQPESSSTFAF